MLLGLLWGLPAAMAASTVAVLPVVVHASGDEEYLQSGVSDMLASRLGRVPGVGVIRVSDPALATTRVEEAQEYARAVGAQFVVFGSFTRFGDGASLDVRCASVDEAADSPTRAIFIQSGSIGELIPRLDGLVEKVGRYVNGGLPPVAAGAAGESNASATAGLAAELEALRARVRALEDAGAVSATTEGP